MAQKTPCSLGVYKRLSRTVLALSRRIDLLRIVEPTNVLEEKVNFISGQSLQPKFEYKRVTFNPSFIDRELSKLTFPSDQLGRMLRQKAHEVYLSNRLVINRENRAEMVRFSEQLYGALSKNLVEKAENIASAVAKKKSRSTYLQNKQILMTSKEVAPILREILARLKLDNWEVIRTSRQASSVNVASRQVKVSTHKLYTKEDVKGLIAHEIFGHVYRATNGLGQPISIFGVGLPGYLPTEEGLAMYLEEKFGVLNQDALLRHALKVIAVDSVRKNFCFKACFNRLRMLGADDDLAWELCCRVFRGGGFLKDHVYLQGYFKVKRWIKGGGDVNRLFVGKIGLHHLDLCADLHRRRLLKKPIRLPPKHLPKIF